MKRLTRKEADALRRELIVKQDNRCALCRDTLDGKTACLDHDHRTGQVREVLCLNCNGIEGKIFNLCRRAKRQGTEALFLASVYDYWAKHGTENVNGFLHPTHKTADEKRLARNARARRRRREIHFDGQYKGLAPKRGK